MIKVEPGALLPALGKYVAEAEAIAEKHRQEVIADHEARDAEWAATHWFYKLWFCKPETSISLHWRWRLAEDEKYDRMRARSYFRPVCEYANRTGQQVELTDKYVQLVRYIER